MRRNTRPLGPACVREGHNFRLLPVGAASLSAAKIHMIAAGPSERFLAAIALNASKAQPTRLR
jgi:hypothetical protein